ncbi:DUF2442 domain-containing protein [Pseudoduganella rhizocola]|uniref:DUF2442 domain-containing protein n=1 Tax=Pseudoduganella rhizocola TaxID=3382643 RepID=UPI0038B47C45
MAVINAEIMEAANRRAVGKQGTYPTVVAARYDRRISRVVLSLDSGLDLAFSPRHAQGLEHARPRDLDVVEISPSGLGIYFPKIDADLYIPSLIEGFLGSKRWLAAQHGKAGGAATTSAKQAAARANGKLGGRPKKAVAKIVEAA